jgi:murein L,D-transpeptidase YcbB/YkuD
VIVNVAGFEMAVMKDNQPALAMKVVVGKTGNETPIFRDTMESIVVNPYWNVPPNIYREEVLPAMQRDPGYLARNNMEVVGRGGDVGVRQRRARRTRWGGQVPLPERPRRVHARYSCRSAFSRQTRAFSHGCIRLEKPRELAYYLFEHAAGRTRADYDRLVGGGEKWVQLKEKLPVYVVYFTAWPDSNGASASTPTSTTATRSSKRWRQRSSARSHPPRPRLPPSGSPPLVTR